MKYSRVTLALTCFLAVVLQSYARTAPVNFTVKADVYEVLYFGSGILETQKVGNIGPVVVSSDSQSAGMNSLIEKFVQFAQGYLSRKRAQLSFGLNGFAGSQTAIQKAIIYEVNKGNKGTQRISVAASDLLGMLDKSKDYAFLPLLAGYDCDLVNISYSNGSWILQDERGVQPVSSVTCKQESRPEWTTLVELASVTVPMHTYEKTVLGNSIVNSAYDAVESLGERKYHQLKSFRVVEAAYRAWRKNTPPYIQKGQSRKMAFVLKLYAQ
jgi:hypothetical protein